MNRELKINELIKVWNERNPQHELNSDTGKDMFWETVLMVFEDLNNKI